MAWGHGAPRGERRLQTRGRGLWRAGLAVGAGTSTTEQFPRMVSLFDLVAVCSAISLAIFGVFPSPTLECTLSASESSITRYSPSFEARRAAEGKRPGKQEGVSRCNAPPPSVRYPPTTTSLTRARSLPWHAGHALIAIVPIPRPSRPSVRRAAKAEENKGARFANTRGF